MLTAIDPWFLRHRSSGRDRSKEARSGLPTRTDDAATPCRHSSSWLLSDAQLADLSGKSPIEAVRACARSTGHGRPTSLVDTCAAEFEAYTPYYYSTYEHEDEVRDRAE